MPHVLGKKDLRISTYILNRLRLIAVCLPATILLLFCTTHAQAALSIDLELNLATPAATPESALSSAVPTICTAVSGLRNPTVDQAALVSTCAAIQGSTNQLEIDAAYEALSTRVATAEINTTNRIVISPDVSEIGARLSALRHGMTTSLPGLSLQLNGQPIPAESFAQLLASAMRGGSAGESPQASFASRLGWFVSGNFTDATQSRTNTELGFDSNAQGVTGGVDYRFMDNLFAGVSLSFSQSDADLDNNAGSLEGDNFNITLYGTRYVKDKWHLDGTFHVGQGSYDLKRRIQFTVGTTTVSETAGSGTDSDQFGFSVGGGYTFQLPNAVEGTALAGLSYSRANIDGFTESGASGYSLSVSGQSIDRVTLNAGGQFTRPTSVSWGVISPLVSLFLLYELENDGEEIRAHFVNDPSQTSFSFKIEDRDDFYLNFAIGASMTFARGMSSFVQVKTLQMLDDFDETSLNFGFRMEL